MGETKASQKRAKLDMDHKLKLAAPSREVLEELALKCANEPSPDMTFQYAFCLSKSEEPSELRYAVAILDGLVKEGYEHQIDCMYGAATALYLLGEYDAARVRCENILRNRPGSRSAAELHLAAIESQEEQNMDNLKKVAMNSGVALAAVGAIAGVVGFLLTKR